MPQRKVENDISVRLVSYGKGLESALVLPANKQDISIEYPNPNMTRQDRLSLSQKNKILSGK